MSKRVRSKSLYQEEVLTAYLSHLRTGVTRQEAAQAMGMVPSQVARVLREDPALLDMVREAETEMFTPVLRAAREAALTTDAFGEPNLEAIKLVLDYKKHLDTLALKAEEARARNKRDTDSYGNSDQRALPSGQPNQGPAGLVFVLPTDDQLAKMERALQVRKGLASGTIIDAESEEK